MPVTWMMIVAQRETQVAQGVMFLAQEPLVTSQGSLCSSEDEHFSSLWHLHLVGWHILSEDAAHSSERDVYACKSKRYADFQALKIFRKLMF